MKKRISKKQKRKTYKKKSKGGNRLKIALVFSGQPRFVSSSSYESIKSNLLDRYDCDTYSHFWLSNSKSHNFRNNSAPNINKINKNIEDFKILYTPINIQIDEPLNEIDVMNPLKKIDNLKFINDNNKLYDFIYKYISRYTSFKKAFSLIKDITKYDYIINLRTDLLINKLPDLNTLSKDKIYSPLRNRNDNEKYVDTLNILPNKYASYLFNLIDIFTDIYIKYGSGIFITSEEMMYRMFEHYNILQYCENIPVEQFNAKLVRENGDLVTIK